MKAFCLVLCGLPAAGKSTLAQGLARALNKHHGIQALIVSSDTVREEIPALTKTFLPELEPAVRKMTLDRVASGLEQGFFVIHDDLNYYRSMRFELVNLARQARAPQALIHLHTNRERCLAQNAARGRKVPDEVIEKDSRRFDAPGTAPWDTTFATLCGSEITDTRLRELAKQLLAFGAKFQPQPPPSPSPHNPSRAEELDLLSRKVVGELCRASQDPEKGQIISRVRRQLVKRALEDHLDDQEAGKFFRQVLE